MTAKYKNRLLKLAAFIRTVPREQFDMHVVSETIMCGTVCCAMGWTTKVFPRLVVDASSNSLDLKATGWTHWTEAGMVLFGLTTDQTRYIFGPYQYTDPHDGGAVADRIEAFVKENGKVPNAYALESLID